MKTKKLLIPILAMLLLCSCQKQGEIETTTATTTTPEVVTVTTTEKTTTEETTTTAETEKVMIPDSYGEWFLAEPEWPLQVGNIPPTVRVSPENQNCKVITPIQHTTTIEHLTFTVDFFKEEYQFGQVLQTRITIHNNSAEPFSFTWTPKGCGIRGTAPDHYIDFYYFRYDQTHYMQATTKYDEIPANGSKSYEYIFLINDDFAGSEQLTFEYTGVEGYTDNYLVQVPLKVVRK